VTLSVILDADATLRFPDFRSEERTFAMVTQLAGRSGRGPDGGKVIVQTLAPDAPSIALAARHDAPGFLAGELRWREALRYPPYSHLVAINLASAHPEPLERAAARLAEALRESVPPGTDVLGPATMFRVRGRDRRRLLLKTARRAETVAAVREVVEGLAAGRALRSVAIGVDVDPQ
jgi:primosomal protein N' (replication factor Y)